MSGLSQKLRVSFKQYVLTLFSTIVLVLVLTSLVLEV